MQKEEFEVRAGLTRELTAIEWAKTEEVYMNFGFHDVPEFLTFYAICGDAGI